MKKIIISVRPEWVAKILNGEKTVELRKSMPKCELPCEVYIYCTRHSSKYNFLIKRERKYDVLNGRGVDIYYNPLNSKIVAKFTLNTIYELECLHIRAFQVLCLKGNYDSTLDDVCNKLCLTNKQIVDYCNRKINKAYGWKIDDLEIYDEPKKLEDFKLQKAPQSWCYIK